MSEGYDYVAHRRIKAKVEKQLGHKLPEGTVLHQAYGTWVICPDQAYHLLLHQRENAFKSCGNVNGRKCQYCKNYDNPENLNIYGNSVYHPKCRSQYQENKREGWTEEKKNEYNENCKNYKRELKEWRSQRKIGGNK